MNVGVNDNIQYWAGKYARTIAWTDALQYQSFVFWIVLAFGLIGGVFGIFSVSVFDLVAIAIFVSLPVYVAVYLLIRAAGPRRLLCDEAMQHGSHWAYQQEERHRRQAWYRFFMWAPFMLVIAGARLMLGHPRVLIPGL